MGNRRYLSVREQEDAIALVAAKGENYDRFIEWCDQQHIPGERRYTAAYFHKWVHKKRPAVHVAKARHQDEVRRVTVMQKSSRVSILQTSVERIQGHIKDVSARYSECEECGEHRYDITTLLKLEEQLRKTLEAISKELGELNKPLEKDEDTEGKGLDAELMLLLRAQKQLSAPAPIDATYRVLPEGS